MVRSLEAQLERVATLAEEAAASHGLRFGDFCAFVSVDHGTEILLSREQVRTIVSPIESYPTIHGPLAAAVAADEVVVFLTRGGRREVLCIGREGLCRSAQ